MNNIKPLELHKVKNRTEFESFLRNIWKGAMPDLIIAEPETGNYTHDKVKKKVHKRINAILKNAVRIKIGVTGDELTRRDGSDYRNGWYNMELVYKTKSKEAAKLFEVELITKYMKSRNKDKVANKSANLASRITTYDGYYLIYVVWNKTHWTGV